MRIVEVRRFLGTFIVYVNYPEDMKKLSHNTRFFLYASYKDLKNNFRGKEFKFKCKYKTLKAAKDYICTLLKEKK